MQGVLVAFLPSPALVLSKIAYLMSLVESYLWRTESWVRECWNIYI